ncbi:hypothetical protein P4V86_15425 [Brevibacillus laterosporus]|uniref:hypothetical protein n=1 Tax=Brevibacillus laterosporus TaxID=1465 RepID=UPI0012FDEABA|nr:hypothetical protein [Brevibacillus laterosporus]MED2004736.1 hypothetical protein [Brevibacillus laterosporus]
MATITQQEAEKLTRANGECQYYDGLSKHYAELAARSAAEKNAISAEMAGRYGIKSERYHIDATHREIREGWV